MSIVKEVYQLARKHGYTGVTELVDDFISSGGTFVDLHKFLSEKCNIWRSPITVYRALREYLTVPYGSLPRWEYYWNMRARKMGYNNVYKMFEEFRTKKLLTSEVAEKLKISHMRTSQLLRVFNEKRSQRYWPGKGKGKRRNKDGFVNRYAYQRWLKVAHKLGHSTVTEAILTFKRLGYTKRAVAKEFGVNEVTFRNHLKRAKIKW